ncbi:MAG: hypothetical protein ABI811_10660 [Acidobacteriota bacterium]
MPVVDLRASELGDKLEIAFTLPELTTDGLPLIGVQEIELLVGPGGDPFSRDGWAATAQHYQVSPKGPGAYEHEIPATGFVGQALVLAVRATGRTGRASDWSNYGYLAVGAPLAPPSDVAAANAVNGVALRWNGSAPRYRILRAVPADLPGDLKVLGESTTNTYVDESTNYGVRYEYVVVGLGGEKQQSKPSAAASITPADVFAPAVPGVPSVVAGAGSIDLSWTRNGEEDLEGYNLFRATDNGPFEPVASRLALPAFSDTKVESGKRYRYVVSAVDTAGNESARSGEVEARIQ